MQLTRVESSLVLAAFFRGMRGDEGRWISNTDQILTLSLFYTGDISAEDCTRRFSQRGYISNLYEENGELQSDIASRYGELIELLRNRDDLIQGSGDFETPQHPTFTSCRLTHQGVELAASIADLFPTKPDFPNWPDRRRL